MISDYINDWLEVIENMSNDNTYKLAWGRSILELIGEKGKDMSRTINFDELSPKIIKYYWNQIYFFNLKQCGYRKTVIEKEVLDLINKYKSETGNNLPEWYEKAEEHFKSNKVEYTHLIKKISTILSQNVSYRFLNVKDKVIPLYEYDLQKRTISFTNYQIEQIYDYRYILSQLLNFKWAQLLENYNTAPKISKKVKGLSDAKLRRNSLKKYKDALLKACDNNPKDFYTGKPLSFDEISVDHVIPWSFMYSDDIWNLVLTSKSNNSSKLNKTPSQAEIDRLKERNADLLEKIDTASFARELSQAIEGNYVDKFYNALRL